MSEKSIDLEGINPIDIYGPNNNTLSYIIDFFQK